MAGMVREEAQQMLERLCGHFNLPVPKLAWSNTFAGHYRPKGPYKVMYECGKRYQHYKDPTQFLICIGSRNGYEGRGMTAENVLLHEFSHYLTHSKREFRVGCSGGHEIGFSRSLTDVVKFWYAGDTSKYQWGKEYVCVRKRGPLPDLD